MKSRTCIVTPKVWNLELDQILHKNKESLLQINQEWLLQWQWQQQQQHKQSRRDPKQFTEGVFIKGKSWGIPSLQVWDWLPPLG